MITAGYTGGAPILGQGLALDLMNTYHSVRGKLAEGLDSPETATAWLRAVAGRLSDTGARSADQAEVQRDDLDALLRLRESMRCIAGNLVGGEAPDQQYLDCVNRSAALAPLTISMTWRPDAGGTKTRQVLGTPVEQALGALATDAIELFTGSNATRLRLCERPGCVLFFLKDHPRREWCTPACGARVRAARSYQKRLQRERVAAAR